MRAYDASFQPCKSGTRRDNRHGKGSAARVEACASHPAAAAAAASAAAASASAWAQIALPSSGRQLAGRLLAGRRSASMRSAVEVMATQRDASSAGEGAWESACARGAGERAMRLAGCADKRMGRSSCCRNVQDSKARMTDAPGPAQELQHRRAPTVGPQRAPLRFQDLLRHSRGQVFPLCFLPAGERAPLTPAAVAAAHCGEQTTPRLPARCPEVSFQASFAVTQDPRDWQQSRSQPAKLACQELMACQRAGRAASAAVSSRYLGGEETPLQSPGGIRRRARSQDIESERVRSAGATLNETRSQGGRRESTTKQCSSEFQPPPRHRTE